MAGAVRLSASETLPADGFSGALAGRVWRPDVAGPSVVAIRAGGVFDISAAFRPCAISARLPTRPRACRRLAASGSARLRTSSPIRRPTREIASKPWLLAPIDLQAIKAAGVTFADLDDRTSDRGTRPRQSAGGGGDPQDILHIVGDDLSAAARLAGSRARSRRR